MKKLIVIALAVVMMVSAVAVLAACGTKYEGEYSYDNSWTPGEKYGCHVTVTVNKGVISAIDVQDDSETFYNLSSGWEGKQTWLNGRQAMIDSFIGLSVADVQKIVVAKNSDSTKGAVGQPTGITGTPTALKVVAGATQSNNFN